MTDLEIAETILKQLGGRRFLMMTGAKDLMSINCGLKMSLPRNASKANRLEITLTGMDDYIMRFYRFTPAGYSTRGGKFTTHPEKVTEVKKFENIYFDQLQELFTEVTGMETHF